MTSRYGPTVVRSITEISSASWVRRHSENTQASGPCAPDQWPSEPKINRRRRQTVQDYYCAKFRVIPIRGFRFYHANVQTSCLTHTRARTHREKVIAISAPPSWVNHPAVVTEGTRVRRQNLLYVVRQDDDSGPDTKNGRMVASTHPGSMQSRYSLHSNTRKSRPNFEQHFWLLFNLFSGRLLQLGVARWPSG